VNAVEFFIVLGAFAPLLISVVPRGRSTAVFVLLLITAAFALFAKEASNRDPIYNEGDLVATLVLPLWWSGLLGVGLLLRRWIQRRR
jgi:hypothetical protein